MLQRLLFGRGLVSPSLQSTRAMKAPLVMGVNEKLLLDVTQLISRLENAFYALNALLEFTRWDIQ